MSCTTVSESVVIISFLTLHARFTFEAHTLPGGFPHGRSVRRCARHEVCVISRVREGSSLHNIVIGAVHGYISVERSPFLELGTVIWVYQ